ncbi:MAG: curli production assembly protein CsgG [Acidobacteria bacterium]|nr:curli production assembly protein CsgG [Acidobacteriota bacterium]
MTGCARRSVVGAFILGAWLLAGVVPAASAQSADTPVDQVIALEKSGLSDDLIIRAIARDKLHGDLGTSDMLKLKNAGVSDRVITAMMEGPPAPAASAAPMPVAAPVSAVDPRASMRRAAIDEFDWATVSTSVQAIFGTNVDIGKGIRALLTKRLQEAGRIRLVERAKVDTVMKEQDFGASNRVRQGTNARIGQILGADVYLMGDIVAFGRDDRDKRLSLGAFGFGGPLGGVRIGKKEDKAVVTINYRLVDAETSEVIDSGEASGESKRKSSGLGGIFGWSGGVVGGSVDMTSQNFAETIIGEAVIEATDRIAVIMNEKVPGLPRREVDIEARVAAASGGSITITAGSNQGVEVGQQFDVFRIVAEIKDPVTGEVLDNEVEQLGVMTVSSVRERVATGAYVGTPVTGKDGLVRRRLP